MIEGGFDINDIWSKYGKIIIGAIIIIVVLVIIIIIVVLIVKSDSSNEAYCSCNSQDTTDDIEEVKEKLNDFKKKIDNRETFVSTGGSAFVNKQGDIEGARVFSDMYSKVPFGELRSAVENNKPFPANETLGAGKGDNFDLQFQQWRATQEKDSKDPCAVKTMAEIEETSKSVSANLGNDTSCMLTRAGSSRAKIKLEPNGTIAVCEEYSTPERDKNRTIYMGSYLVHVPGYQLDTNRINDEVVLGTSDLAKNFSPKDNKVISTASATATEATARGATNSEMIAETFSSNVY